MAITPDEGRRLYRQAELKCQDSQTQKRTAETQLTTNTADRNRASNQKSQNVSEKTNLEKRLAQVNAIISDLTGTVPSQLVSANRSAKTADEKYHTAIICRNGGSAPSSIEVSFRTKGVEEDGNSASALQSCRTEKTRIENEIARLDREISQLAAQIDQLKSNIRSCQIRIDTCASDIGKYQRQMQEYNRYRYM